MRILMSSSSRHTQISISSLANIMGQRTVTTVCMSLYLLLLLSQPEHHCLGFGLLSPFNTRARITTSIAAFQPLCTPYYRRTKTALGSSHFGNHGHHHHHYSDNNHNSTNSNGNDESFYSDDHHYSVSLNDDEQSRNSNSQLDEMDRAIMDEAKRMDIIRSLQESFYKTVSASRINNLSKELQEKCKNMDSDAEECQLIDIDTPDAIFSLENPWNDEVATELMGTTQCRVDGSMIHNLPLWRVQWTELPGRTNVLMVHEAMYTNMFEEILRSEPSQPWYVGHLYLPGGSDNLPKLHHYYKENNEVMTIEDADETPNNTRMYKLHGWQNDDSNFDMVSNTRSAVVGTLLRITDYRRLADGKLLLMVQGLHRFVVQDVVQTLPYGIANVQLLPDWEEVEDTAPVTSLATDSSSLLLDSSEESTVSDFRTQAVDESLHHWYRYEYDHTPLPLKHMEYLPLSDIVFDTSLTKLVPFASFSKHLDSNSFVRDLWLINELNRHKNNEQIMLEQANKAFSSSTESTAPVMTDEERFNLGSATPVFMTDDERFNMGRFGNNHKMCLEKKLINAKILQEPDLLQKESLMNLSLDELEIRLWFALNDYATTTNTRIPLVLLELLPHDVSYWPQHHNFLLKNLVLTLELQNGNNRYDHRTRSSSTGSFTSGSLSPNHSDRYNTKHNRNRNSDTSGHNMGNHGNSSNNSNFARVSQHYPALRRQQRLSYHAAQLLEEEYAENKEAKNELRQKLLRIPTIKGRLAFVTQYFENIGHAFE